MFIWCAILFILGIAAFIDSMLNMGAIFRTANSVLFLLISLGLLIRTTTKMKSKKLENYEERVFNLERQVKVLQDGKKKLAEF